jgi:uncharacterized protein YbjQ (UPF0145 family)
MPECEKCGVYAGMLRGGRCKTCHDLFQKAKSGNDKAAQAFVDRGGELSGYVSQRKKISEAASDIAVTTEMSVLGVIDRLGVVTGQCALGMNIFRDFTAEISDIVGGRSGAYQKAVKEAKDQCIEDMKIEAVQLGADAVIAMDLDFNEITGGGGLFGGKGMIMVVATGTAVRLKGE